MKIPLKIAFCILLSGVFLMLSGKAYSEDIRIEHISLDKGISNNLIFSMYQDSKGFLWFGTMYGLIKFDGLKYTTYRYNPSDTNSLSGDDVISIFEDSKGYLWIGTFNSGVNRYDRKTGIFKRYLSKKPDINTLSDNTIWSINEDKEGTLWFGTGKGLNKLVNSGSTDERFTRYEGGVTEGTPEGQINSLAIDNSGALWIGTFGEGLKKLVKSSDGNYKNDRFITYKRDSNNTNSISSSFIRSIYADKDNILWIGTIKGGLNKFYINEERFQSFSGTEGGVNKSNIENVNAIGEDNTGNLWLGLNSGFAKYDKQNNIFTRYTVNTPGSWKSEMIVALCIDHSGILWAGTYYGGLHKIFLKPDRFNVVKSPDGRNYPLSSNFIGAVLEDRAGNIWAGTTRGLDFFKKSDSNMFDSSNAKHIKLESKAPYDDLINNSINALLEDREGNIWIGANQGLKKYNPVTKSIERFPHIKGDTNTLSFDNVYSLAEDPDGNIWIGTAYGLNKYNLSEPGKFKSYLPDPKNNTSLNNSSVLSLYCDRNGDIWAGTYEGLNLYNKSTDNFTSYQKDPYNPNTLSNNYIYSYCEDKDGNFWIGTGGGLNKFIKAENRFEHYSEADGLANDVICGIVEDENSSLWISTNKGISKFDRTSGVFRNFDVEDGLQSNMFNQGVSLKRKNGEIIFGGINGLNIFTPSKIKDNSFKAPVVISGLTRFGENRYIESDISSSKEIELKYDENFFSLEFASMDFTNPRKNKFSYKLEGFDKDWIKNESNNRAVYTNLDPGKYIFKVKATNSDGVWNETPAEIKIVIVPPFWKTWWFYAISGIIIVLAAAGFYNYEVRKKLRRLLEIERIKSNEREKVREQASKDYHDELGHKLTRISLYGRRINRKMSGKMNGITGEINSIIETSNSLRDSAKDLIWSLNPEEDTLYDFAVRLKNFGNELYDETGINFYMNDSPDEFKLVKLGMDYKRNMIYIFKESMNNILKYSECKNVRLEICRKKDIVNVIVTDDGIGFNKDNGSKGYGLKNILSRAKHMNAGIEIVSFPGKGTSVILNVDLTKSLMKNL